MDYPKKDKYLTFKQISAEQVEVEDKVREENWEMCVETALFLIRLDGNTDPYSIYPKMDKEEVDELLNVFEEEGLLWDGKNRAGFGLRSRIVPVLSPENIRKFRPYAVIWNQLLMLLWLPVFASGVIILFDGKWDGREGDFGIVFGFLICFLGIMAHKISHTAAYIHYDGERCEFGIMMCCLFPGIYTSGSYGDIHHRMKRIQTIAAGTEANFLIAGICFCLLKTGYFDPYALLVGAILNTALAVFNCTLNEGADGVEIFDELLGKRNFFEEAKEIIGDKNGKAELRKRDINGHITLLACYIVVFMQIELPLILICLLISFSRILI